MLLKWVITITIVYFVYKYYIKPNALGQGEEQKRSQIRNSDPEADNEDEYIDYEEVE